MIRLFKSTETDFSHNETVLNEIISCKVTEEINEDYIVELEYSIEDNKKISSDLVTAKILSVPTIDSRENQSFRIIGKDTASSTITVQAQAKLLADLKANRVKAMTLTGLTRAQAIQKVLDSALESHIYKVGNKDTSTNTDITVNIQEGNLLSAIIGSENSILSEYGGEFIVDNDTMDIVDSRGTDNGVVIEYGKNLSSIKETIDLTDLATVLIPKSGDYRLPEYCVESPLVNNYEKRYFKEIELNLDIWDGDGEKGENQITEEEAYTTMRETCNSMFKDDKVDQIAFNYTVDFVELSKTEEYKNYAMLETVHLGDTVTVKHKKLNLDLQGRVNKITYTVDSEGNTEIDTVEIGFTKKDITNIINDTTITANTASNKINSITETSTDGVTTELSKTAFKVTCSKASGKNVLIDAEGLTVNNGKIMIKNSNGDIVFQVDIDGICNAIGGFVVSDNDTSCTIKADDGLVIHSDKYKCQIYDNGITLTNEHGYTSRFYVLEDGTALKMQDDLYIGKGVFVDGLSYFHDDVEIDTTLRVGEHLRVGGKDLITIIDERIQASQPSA